MKTSIVDTVGLIGNKNFIRCEMCGLLLYNSEKSLMRHVYRMHLGANPHNKKRSSIEPLQYLCNACKIEDCDRCDGGSCRCTCALELDVKRKILVKV